MLGGRRFVCEESKKGVIGWTPFTDQHQSLIKIASGIYNLIIIQINNHSII